jgi:hypothetical protein
MATCWYVSSVAGCSRIVSPSVVLARVAMDEIRVPRRNSFLGSRLQIGNDVSKANRVSPMSFRSGGCGGEDRLWPIAHATPPRPGVLATKDHRPPEVSVISSDGRLVGQTLRLQLFPHEAKSQRRGVSLAS